MPLASRAINTGEIAEERRRIDRIATNIDAFWLAEPDTVACRLLDVSPTGARLKFPDSDVVPNRFELYVPEFQTRYLVDVKWRDGRTISVQFQKSCREEAKARGSRDPGSPTLFGD